MSFYDNLAATASRLISKFGQDITVTRTSGVSIDPITGAATGSEVTLTGKGIYKTYPDSLIDGTLIKRTSKMVVIDNTVTPVMSDKIDGLNVTNIKTSSPAGTDLVYFVQVDQ